jgi:hypothetical protein
MATVSHEPVASAVPHPHRTYRKSRRFSTVLFADWKACGSVFRRLSCRWRMNPEAVPKRIGASSSRPIRHSGKKREIRVSLAGGGNASHATGCSPEKMEPVERYAIFRRSEPDPYLMPQHSRRNGGRRHEPAQRTTLSSDPPAASAAAAPRHITTPSGPISASPSLAAQRARPFRLGDRDSVLGSCRVSLGAPRISRTRLVHSGQWSAPPAAHPARRTVLRRLAPGPGSS